MPQLWLIFPAKGE